MKDSKYRANDLIVDVTSNTSVIISQNRFGGALGERVWESCNAVFDRLPLAGVIDHDIFCVHGGIARPVSASTSRVQVCYHCVVWGIPPAPTPPSTKAGSHSLLPLLLRAGLDLTAKHSLDYSFKSRTRAARTSAVHPE